MSICLFLFFFQICSLCSTPFEDDVCSHLADQDLEGALKAMDVQDPIDPREVAIIKYTPSVDKAHGSYADEVYYPPSVDTSSRDSLRNKILGSNPVDSELILLIVGI